MGLGPFFGHCTGLILGDSPYLNPDQGKQGARQALDSRFGKQESEGRSVID
jgi:hypothetical protein